MSPIDGLLLAAALAAAVALVVGASRLSPAWLWAAAAALAAISIAQAATEGLYLRFVSVWLLAALSAGLAWRAPASRTGRFGVRAGALGLGLAAAGMWLLAPAVPDLPRPTGRYAVGVHVFRWTDASRPEPAGAEPGERRSVIAQLWHPAGAGGGRAPPYIDGLGRLPPSVAGFPSVLMRAYGRIDVHAHGGAPVAPDRARWPLVLFSPGAGAPRAAYSGLGAELASRGVAVAVLDHPYDSAVTRLPDGRVVTDAHRFRAYAGDPARAADFMAAEQGVRAADLRFALDRLTADPTFGPRLRTDRAVAAGHSFGGASAIALWAQEPRIVAAANLDGTVYGDPLHGRRPQGRLLVMESDEALTHHGASYRDGLARVLAQAPGPVERVRLAGASHLSFTDAPAFLAWPVRLALPSLLGRARAADVQREAAERLAALAAETLDR